MGTQQAQMGKWRRFLDSLDTGGGHIFVLVVLILVGYRMYMTDATAGGQIITLSFGALIALLKTTGSNRDQMGSTVTVTNQVDRVPPDPPIAPAPPPAPDPIPAPAPAPVPPGVPPVAAPHFPLT